LRVDAFRKINYEFDAPILYNDSGLAALSRSGSPDDCDRFLSTGLRNRNPDKPPDKCRIGTLETIVFGIGGGSYYPELAARQVRLDEIGERVWTFSCAT
jgi:hypothetical protein